MTNEEYNSLGNKGTKLWNRNFAVLVIGSFISMVGFTCSSFAMSLLVYDQTQSTLKYALTLVCASVPRIIMPLIAGTYFDRHSRRTAIPFIDFCYTSVFALMAIVLFIRGDNYIPYYLYILVSLLLGAFDGAYMVAFDSLFPLTTTQSTSRKAYSINSMLYPIATIITTPLTLLGYEKIGPAKIFLFSTILFAITASIELFIKIREPHMVFIQPEKQAKLPPSPKELELAAQGIDIIDTIEKKEKSNFIADFKEGVRYILKEKGLLAITMYFFVISICGALQQTLMLPYFRTATIFPIDGMWAYLIVFGCSTFGRLIGSNLNYRIKYPLEKRYNIAVLVYITTNLITIIVFHLPMYLMMVVMFVEGCLSVTSYNIRIASTQHYLPDTKRGRFNGTFMFFNMLGSILGQLASGTVGEIAYIKTNFVASVPWIISVTFFVNLIAVFVIIIPAAKYIKPIYNADL